VTDNNTALNAGGLGVLTKSPSAPAATIKNTGGATALNLLVNAGKPPFTVNSPTKVTNLNADQLDNRDSTYFLSKTGKAADSDKLDGVDSTGFLPKMGKAADADKLDGIDSTGFLAGSVVRRFNVQLNPPAGQQLLFTIGQLSFWGTCLSDISTGDVVDFFFSSSAAHAAYAEFQADNGGVPQLRFNGDMGAFPNFYDLASYASNFGYHVIAPATGTIVTADNRSISYNLFATQNAGAATNGVCKFGGSLVVT
jgi:hypothetical protein